MSHLTQNIAAHVDHVVSGQHLSQSFWHVLAGCFYSFQRWSTILGLRPAATCPIQPSRSQVLLSYLAMSRHWSLQPDFISHAQVKSHYDWSKCPEMRNILQQWSFSWGRCAENHVLAMIQQQHVDGGFNWSRIGLSDVCFRGKPWFPVDFPWNIPKTFSLFSCPSSWLGSWIQMTLRFFWWPKQPACNQLATSFFIRPRSFWIDPWISLKDFECPPLWEAG